MRPFFLSIALLFSFAAFSQQRVVRMQHYYLQLQRLKNSTLIVELPAKPESAGIMSLRTPEEQRTAAQAESAIALMEAFKNEYSYSPVIFSYPDGAGRVYIAQDKKEIQPPSDSSAIFICKEVNSAVNKPEIYYELLKDGQWVMGDAYDEKKKESEYQKMMNEMDPEYLGQGGLVIFPIEPHHEKLTKKKRISSAYYYRSRREVRTAVKERYRASVGYLQRKLNKELQEYTKKFD